MANFLQCQRQMNEWMNFIKVIENSTRIILTIGIQFLVFGGVFMEAAR